MNVEQDAHREEETPEAQPWTMPKDEEIPVEQAKDAPGASESAETDSGEVAEEAAAEAPPVVEDPLAKLTEERDKLLRLVADQDNALRRAREETARERTFATRRLVEALLPVLDSFERTREAAERKPNVDAMLKGVKNVERQLRKALASVDVERFESVGKPFDPELHEALDIVAEGRNKPGEVELEVTPGYKMAGEVIRHAQVHVVEDS